MARKLQVDARLDGNSDRVDGVVEELVGCDDLLDGPFVADYVAREVPLVPQNRSQQFRVGAGRDAVDPNRCTFVWYKLTMFV